MSDPNESRSTMAVLVVGGIACLYGMWGLPAEVLAPMTPIIVGLFLACTAASSRGDRRLVERVSRLEAELASLRERSSSA